MSRMPTTSPQGPACPRCRRKLAAWRLDHCVYCGEKFPENIRDGFAEPEALKFVQRPDVPPNAAKQLEMMKHVEIGATKKPRSFATVLVVLTLPIFVGIFYLLYQLLSRYSPAAGIAVIALGLGFLGYVGWMAAKTSH